MVNHLILNGYSFRYTSFFQLPGCHRAEAPGDQKWSAPRPAPEKPHGNSRDSQSWTLPGHERLVTRGFTTWKHGDFRGGTVNLLKGILIFCLSKSEKMSLTWDNANHWDSYPHSNHFSEVAVRSQRGRYHLPKCSYNVAMQCGCRAVIS